MGTTPTLRLLLIVLAVGLLFAATGVAVILRARRGRRVGAHPHCRRCGFDLFGRPAGSDRCPECGADVTRPRAIVVGRRVAHLGWVAFGLLFALASLGTFGTISLNLASRIDWEAARPVWLLLLESRYGNRAIRDAALDSLTRRERYRTDWAVSAYFPRFDADDERAVIERLLDVQADPSLPWKPRWGDLILKRIEDGAVPAPLRDRYFRASLSPASLVARTDIRAGEPLPSKLNVGSGRGASDGRLFVRFYSDDNQVLLDGKPTPEVTNVDVQGMPLERASFSLSYREHRGRLAGLAPGTHTLERRATARVFENSGDGARELFAMPIAASATFTVHPKDARLVELVEDESMRPAIVAGLSRSTLELNGRWGLLNTKTLNVRFPMPMAFKVAIRQNERTRELGSTVSTAAGPGFKFTFGGMYDELQPGKADIVFTSDEVAAAESIDVFKIWKGEIVIKDVPVAVRQ